MLKELMDKVMPSDGVVGLLKADHRNVEKLFDRFEKAKEGKDHRTMVQAIQDALRELTVHAAIEEELVYPAMRRCLDDESLMDEAVEEHHVAHVLIDELQRMQPTDKRYAAKFTVLAESVKHHVKEEESEVFPKAQEAGFETADMKDQVLKRKKQLLNAAATGKRRTAAARSTVSSRARASRRNRASRGKGQRAA